MSKRILTKKEDRIITFILVLIIIILINAIVVQFSPTLDLTNDSIYSLSEESKLMLKSLKEPMTVKLFITPNLPPPFSTYERYVKDLLTQYKSSGKGNFNFEIINATKDPSQAREYGIQPSQISVLEKDQTQTKVAYLGMAILYGDSIESIPFIQSTEGLEYRMSTLIRKMADKNDKLSRLKENLNVYLIVSPEVIKLLPPGSYETLPITVSEAITEANKTLMNKVAFNNVDTKSKEGEEIIYKLDVPKMKWDDIKDNRGDIIVPKGEGYFSLVLQNGDDIKDLSTYPILQGTKEDLIKEITGGIDNILGLQATIGYVEGHGEAKYFSVPPEYGGNPNDTYDTISDYANAIQDTYTFLPIDISSKPIPSNVDAIIIAGSQSAFSEYELYQIDQFIMNGNPVLFLLNGVVINQDQMVQMGMAMPTLIANTNRLNDILPNYGLSVATNFIFDEEAYKASVRQGEPPQSIYYIPLILPENISSKNPITKSIKLMFTPLVSEILLNTNDKNVRITPLVYTSKKSWIEESGATFAPGTMFPPTDTNKFSRHLIAATSEGEMKSAFEGKSIPKPDITNAVTLPIKASIDATLSGKISVIGSYEMAKNNAFTINNVFLMNLVDWMAGDSGLMNIRRKGVVYNPPYSITDFGRFVVRAINIVIVPLAVIVFGIILWNIDKKRRKDIFERFNK